MKTVLPRAAFSSVPPKLDLSSLRVWSLLVYYWCLRYFSVRRQVLPFPLFVLGSISIRMCISIPMLEVLIQSACTGGYLGGIQELISYNRPRVELLFLVVPSLLMRARGYKLFVLHSAQEFRQGHDLKA